MRCAAIAKELIRKGYDTCFIVADEISRSVVESQGIKSIVLNSCWNDLNYEISQICNLLKLHRADWIIIDSYYVTKEYFQELHKWTKIAYIDDLKLFHYECDLLINYSIYASDMKYENEYKNTKLLLGCKYIPLRRQFMNLSIHKCREHVKEVLLLTGGSDTYHVSRDFVNEIVEQQSLWEDITFHIVCGKFNQDILDLERVAQQWGNIKLYLYVEEIETLMQNVDVAVSAGGSTLYELCACGTPTITYCMADNQLQNVNKFHELNLMEYAGDVRKSGTITNIINTLKGYRNYTIRNEKSNNMRRAVDGYGIERIVNAICMERS